MYRVDDVYGISRKLPLNYVERKEVDGKFKEILDWQKHITIFGSSKQGKTCLKKHCLSDDKYINIQCNNRWTLSDLNLNILKRAGFELEASNKKTITGKSKILASIKGKLPFFEAEGGEAFECGNTTEKEIRPLELDPDDVNDVIEALKTIGFNRYIILDDFHYLKTEVQKDFSIELKAFHENSDYCFVVIGVWLDENKLIIYNGDLTGRVVSVNADIWERESLIEVIKKGESLLNVRFDDEFVNSLVSQCFDNVYYVQEVCRRVCIENNIEFTQRQTINLGAGCDVKQMIRKVVNEQSGRYSSFLTQYANGFQDTTLEMHKWLLYPILVSELEDLSNGLKYRKIKEIIQRKHPREKELNPGNLTQALKSVVSLELNKNIQPIIVDYDETNRILHIVDRGFIIWLQFQDRDELLSLLDLPTS